MQPDSKFVFVIYFKQISVREQLKQKYYLPGQEPGDQKNNIEMKTQMRTIKQKTQYWEGVQ